MARVPKIHIRKKQKSEQNDVLCGGGHVAEGTRLASVIPRVKHKATCRKCIDASKAATA